MSHEKTIRRVLEMYAGYWPSADQKRIHAEVRAALDALVAERDTLAAVLAFWVERADRFEDNLPADRFYMKARGVLNQKYAAGRAALAAVREPTPPPACTHDPAQFVTAGEGTSYCPACEAEVHGAIAVGERIDERVESGEPT